MIDRENLKQALVSLPVPFIAVLTIRSVLRYLPAFVESHEGARKEQLFDQRAYYVTPLTRLIDRLDVGSPETDAAEEVHLADRAVVLRSFLAAKTALLAILFSLHPNTSRSFADRSGRYAADATAGAVTLGMLEPDDWAAATWEAMAFAVALSSSSATTAGLTAVGSPTPGTLEDQRANAVSAAIGIVDLEFLASELAAETALLKAKNADPSAIPNHAAVDAEAFRFLCLPLWPRGMPGECEDTWIKVKKKLLGMNAGFDFWVTWYADRLQGVPLDFEAEARWTTPSATWFEIDPAYVMSYLRDLSQGAAARKPKWTVLWSARCRRAARERRRRRLARSPSYLARELLNPAVWGYAARGALAWGNLLPLAFATYSIVSFLIRHLGMELHVPLLILGLVVYTHVKDILFFWSPVQTSYGELSIPAWLKDLSFVYFYVGGLTNQALSLAIPESTNVRWWKNLTRTMRRLWALFWARIAWPWHFLGFKMGWVDPLRVYQNLHPEIFEILRASRGDLSRDAITKIGKMRPDWQPSILLARFLPFFIVYLLIAAFTSSLLLFVNFLLGR